jgi:hypothetical protein
MYGGPSQILLRTLTSRLLSRHLQSTARLSQHSSQLAYPSIARIMTTSIPATMKGVQIEETGGVEVLQYKTDLPVPTPEEGQVLVRNDFIGVNYIDT